MKRILLALLVAASPAMGSGFSPVEIQSLKQHFLENILPNGAIAASPSRQNPNYYYDWIRDSAMAMTLIESWYESTRAPEYKDLLYHYVSWTQLLQHQPDPLPGYDILGEPKFYVHGYPFEGPWGRPQNDGPALRAFVLTRFAQQLLDNNEISYVQTHLYNSNMNPHTMSIIKMDLEYVAHHWQEANFDLWEEVLGHHFFTVMAQQKALAAGAALAHRLNDEKAAIFYQQQADLINSRLQQHLDKNNKLIKATLVPHPGPQKTLELDSAVILGILINPHKKGVFAPHDAYVKNTIDALHHQFNLMFPINNNHPGTILFGRYPGDTYDGYQTNSIGNPWFILTATMAEYYFTLADNVPITNAKLPLINKYTDMGDSYLELIKKYAPDMQLSEQINLISGKQQGAESLTWSYVSLLRAIDLREKVAQKLHKFQEVGVSIAPGL